MFKIISRISVFLLLMVLVIVLSRCNDDDEQPSAEFEVTSDVSNTSMELTVTYLKQTGSISEQGIFWGESPGLSLTSAKIKANSVIGPYKVTIPNLKLGTTYFIRPYAVINNKELVGTEIAVSTETPSYTSIGPLTAGRGQRVKITGTFLTDDVALAVLRVGGLDATIVSFSSTSLEFLVPEGADMGASLDVNLTLSGYALTLSEKITVSAWSLLQNVPYEESFYSTLSTSRHGDFFLNGAAYRFVGLATYRYTPTSDSWEILAPAFDETPNPYRFPAGPIVTPFYVTIDGKAYMGAGSSSFETDVDYNHLYEFDAVKGAWTRKADFPGVDHNPVYPGGFTSNGSKGYYLASGTSRDFWEYDADKNEWNKLVDYPGSTVRYVSAFSINEYVFFGGGLSSSFQLEFYAYNTIDHTWTQVASLPDGSQTGPQTRAAFAIGQHGYLLVDNQIFTYDFASNNWSRHREVVPGSVTRTRPAVFVNNDYVIIGGGISKSSEIQRDFYRWYPKQN